MERLGLLSTVQVQDFVCHYTGFVGKGEGHKLWAEKIFKQNIDEDGNLPLGTWENKVVLAWILEMSE